MVAACLVKDPKKRPTSEKLLKHHFFKHARSTDYLGRTIIDNLAPLGERFRVLKVSYLTCLFYFPFCICCRFHCILRPIVYIDYFQAKEADLLVQNKGSDKEHLSQVRIELCMTVYCFSSILAKMQNAHFYCSLG